MTHDELVVVEHDALITWTLRRVDRRNALNGQLLERMTRELARVEADSRARVLVLRAEGPTFCAGMDLHELCAGTGPEQHGQACARYAELLRRLHTCNKVVVAEVDSQVLAGGIGLVAAADFVLAGERATFSLPEAFWELAPAMVFPYLRRRVGTSAARALALTTTPIGASRAYELGLVDQLSTDPARDLHRLCARLRRLTNGAIARVKQMAEQQAPFDEALLVAGVRFTAAAMQLPETQASVAQFLREQGVQREVGA